MPPLTTEKVLATFHPEARSTSTVHDARVPENALVDARVNAFFEVSDPANVVYNTAHRSDNTAVLNL